MQKILLADDDKIIIDFIKNSVPKDFPGQIDLAETALEAIDLINKNRYDKAIIDLHFEGEDLTGFDILKVAEKKRIQERIIFTSISNQMEDLIGAGATAAFRKPLSALKIAKFLLTNDYDLLREGEIF